MNNVVSDEKDIERKLRNAHYRIYNLEAKNFKLQKECRANLNTIIKCKSEADYWRSKSDELKLELFHVCNSKSWRITNPLRVVMSRLRVIIDLICSRLKVGTRSALQLSGNTQSNDESTLSGENKESTSYDGKKVRELEKLKYLERVIDTGWSRDEDRGPLSEKEIIIYSPYKTGSRTLLQSIKEYLREYEHNQHPSHMTFHNHDNRSLITILRLPNDLTPEELSERYIIQDLVRYKELTSGYLRIVSSNREPLSRAISHAFHDLEDQVYRRNDLGVEDLSYEVCLNRFEYMLQQSFSTIHSLEEIEEGFFDHYKYSHETDSCFVRQQHCEILCLRLESSHRWQEALETYFGFKGIKIRNSNLGIEKKLGDIQKEFKNQLELPDDLIQYVYYGDHLQQRALRWFYATEEINDFYLQALEKYGSRRFGKVNS